MTFVYRLEAFWCDWDMYFSNPLFARKAQPIDDLNGYHGIEKEESIGHAGFWCIDKEDVKEFQNKEGPGYDWDSEAKKWNSPEYENAAMSHILRGHSSIVSFRVVSRINKIAFKGFERFPDGPLRHNYPTSHFYFAKYNLSQESSAGGDLIKNVSVDNKYIELFINGKWHPKNPKTSTMLRQALDKAQNIRPIVFD